MYLSSAAVCRHLSLPCARPTHTTVKVLRYARSSRCAKVFVNVSANTIHWRQILACVPLCWLILYKLIKHDKTRLWFMVLQPYFTKDCLLHTKCRVNKWIIKSFSYSKWSTIRVQGQCLSVYKSSKHQSGKQGQLLSFIFRTDVGFPHV